MPPPTPRPAKDPLHEPSGHHITQQPSLVAHSHRAPGWAGTDTCRFVFTTPCGIWTAITPNWDDQKQGSKCSGTYPRSHAP